MGRTKKRIQMPMFRAAAAGLLSASLLTGLLTGCGSSTTGLSVDADGKYSFAKVSDAAYYVIEFYDSEDVSEDGTISEDASYALKQTLNASDGTSGTLEKVTSLSFGTYTPIVYAIMSDKTTTDIVVGDDLVIGGTLTAPEIVVQRDYDSIKVSVTDKSFDDVYFVSETVYSFTVEVYTDADCSGDPVATETFGSDAAYIEPTNSDNAVWLRNRSVSISLEDGTYYVRCKADGNSDDQVEDSEYSEVQEVTVSSTETDVNYFVATYDPETGTLASTDGSALEFGNGSTFSSFTITDDADTVAEDDLYTFNGEANCDMHLTGSEGDTSGEAYTNGPRLMPIDKPDLRGTWELNDDGTITVKIMADYQYYVDEADKKTS